MASVPQFRQGGVISRTGEYTIPRETADHLTTVLYFFQKLKHKKKKKMKYKRARKLAMSKWNYLRFNSNSKMDGQANEDMSRMEIPELKLLSNGCGYCEKYLNAGMNGDCYCYGCPLNFNGLTCFSNAHPYGIWTKNPTKANAEAMYNLIKGVPKPKAGWRIERNEDYE